MSSDQIIAGTRALAGIGEALSYAARDLEAAVGRVDQLQGSLNTYTSRGVARGAQASVASARQKLANASARLSNFQREVIRRQELLDATESNASNGSREQNWGDHALGFLKGAWSETRDMVSGTAVWIWDRALINPRNITNPLRLWEIQKQDASGLWYAVTHLDEAGEAFVEPIVSNWQNGRRGEAAGHAFVTGLSFIPVFGVAKISKLKTLDKFRKFRKVAKTIDTAEDIAKGISRTPLNRLPSEAETTLKRIKSGGPFPYPRDDGKIFKNREGRLPTRPEGYYREFTVETPGATNRAKRRIVYGQNGEVYYTDDHYAPGSFVRVE